MNHCRTAMAHHATAPATVTSVTDLAIKQAGAERKSKPIKDSSPVKSTASNHTETLRGTALIVACIAGSMTALLSNNFHWEMA